MKFNVASKGFAVLSAATSLAGFLDIRLAILGAAFALLSSILALRE